MKTLVIGAILATALAAHDSYIMPAKFVVKSGSRLLVSLQNGDSFPVSEFPTDPARIEEMQLSDKSAVDDFRIVGRATYGFVNVAKSGSFYVSARLQPKFLELGAEKFESYLKEEGLLKVIAARSAGKKSDLPGREIYTKHAKTFIVSDAPGKEYAVPVGHEIEFVPESDPALLRAGSALRVRVLFRNKPLADAQVQKAWAGGGSAGRSVVGRTDKTGRISIPVETEGNWRLHVVHMVPCADASKADWESFWASLTFEVPPSVMTRR